MPRVAADPRFRNKRLEMLKKVRGILFALGALSCSPGLAEDAYYEVPLRSLTLSDGKLPTEFDWASRSWQIVEALQPHAVMDVNAEAYLGGEALQPWSTQGRTFPDSVMIIRAEKGSPMTGRLFVPKRDLSGMEG